MLATRSSTYDPSARGPDASVASRALWRGVRAGLAAILALTVMAVAAPTALAAPWPCDSAGYVVQKDATTTNNENWFQRVDRQADGTYTLTQLGIYPNNAAQLNALGFRVQDGFMYSWNVANDEVIQIGFDPGTNQATFTSLGVPAGVPAGFSTVVGTFLENGTYFVWGNATGQPQVGLIIDVTSTPTPTVVATVTPDFDVNRFGFVDFAVNPADGELYTVTADTVQGTALWQLELAGNQLSFVRRVADATAGAGAQWFSPYGEDGTMIAYEGNTSLYSIDVATGAETFLGDAPSVSNVDGTACANGIAVTKDASPRTVTAGNELTYTYEVTSRALVNAQVNFVDQLPAGMTYVPGGVTLNPAFGTLNNYGGTGTLSLSGTMAPNSTVTITARVRVAANRACGVDVDNQAQGTLNVSGLPPVTINSDDPTTPGDPTDPTTVRVTCPPPAANVTLEKTASDTSVIVGDTVTYRLVARNQGPGAATDARISDTVPSRLDVRSASATQGTCSVTGNQVSCAVGTLAVGQTATVTIEATAIDDGGATNNATVTSPRCANTPCDTGTVTVRIREPKLQVTKVVNKGSIRAGETATYTIRVRNPSEARVRNVRVCDRLPSGLVFVSATPKPTMRNGQHCWTVRRLGAGSSKTFKLTVRALRSTSGRKVNRVTATSPDARTDQARRSVRVRPARGVLPAGGVTG